MIGNLLFLTNKLNEMSRLFLSGPKADVISGRDIVLIAIGHVALIIGYVAYYRLHDVLMKFLQSVWDFFRSLLLG
jgi:hypothetical protein